MGEAVGDFHWKRLLLKPAPEERVAAGLKDRTYPRSHGGRDHACLHKRAMPGHARTHQNTPQTFCQPPRVANDLYEHGVYAGAWLLHTG